MKSFQIQTAKRNEFIEITGKVRSALQESGTQAGCCIVYCPHTTAAITINENADPDVVHDLLLWLNRAIPKDQSGFRHGEGNSDSHIKASLFGSIATVIVDNGQLMLGRWQGIWFCEFDGPRSREFQVKILRDH